MRVEKWQALGNDYIVVEARALPFALTAGRVRLLCDRHHGVGGDGVLELSAAAEPGFVARLRIFNPDGSEAELSGNGAREAIMYLHRRGWTDAREFSIETVAGELRPRIESATRCTVDMGRARLRGDGELDAGGRRWAYQHIEIGNPQTAIRVADRDALEALDLPAIGPAIERHPAFPGRTNVSWWTEVGPGAIRARIFERGVGETLSSGTGATGAAIAHVLRGGDSPVTVHLDGGELTVDVGEDLHVDLAGWAVPVFAADLDTDFLRALQSA